MPSPLYCLEQSNLVVVSEWSRASRWSLHPTFPRNQQEGSRWSPSVILKCVNRNRRLPSNIKNVTWLPCLAWLPKELLPLHRLDNWAAAHRKTGPILKPLCLPAKGGCTAASHPAPWERGGAVGKSHPKWLLSVSPLSLPCLPNSQPNLPSDTSCSRQFPHLSVHPCCLAHMPHDVRLALPGWLDSWNAFCVELHPFTSWV